MHFTIVMSAIVLGLCLLIILIEAIKKAKEIFAELVQFYKELFKTTPKFSDDLRLCVPVEGKILK